MNHKAISQNHRRRDDPDSLHYHNRFFHQFQDSHDKAIHPMLTR
jgi:hypothetical protein